MREIDLRMYVAHHDQLNLSIDRGLARLRSAVARLASWDGTTAQLGAMIIAFAITALTFNSTAA